MLRQGGDDRRFSKSRTGRLVCDRNPIPLVNHERVKGHFPSFHFESKLLLDSRFEEVGKLVTATYKALIIHLQSNVKSSREPGPIDYPFAHANWRRAPKPFREI